MIDIHSHILFGVDDGSKDINTSLKMLKAIEKEGVTDVILTPHFEYSNAKEPKEYKDNFEALKAKATEKGIKVNLYLGQEINNKEKIVSKIEEGKALTLNGSKYVLIEFAYEEKSDIPEVAYELVLAGYMPILAHVERYEYLTAEDVSEIKSFGGLIQVNAAALVGKSGRIYKKRARWALKNDYVDFVASDYHSGRPLELKKAYKYVKRRYGLEKAEALFKTNAEQIIKG